MAASRSLRDKERNLHRLENKVKGARERVKQQRVIQTKLDESSDNCSLYLLNHSSKRPITSS